ncbi:alpha/beta hydrolase [Mesorhizobium sp. M7A.F.Ca.US.011.01.1.1]|uniref:alpha/beta fold hydrolase n=1 Tax=Mesorhizobium sp. M7A.F.Ca.US.011.01.1.1 TaxID=2496741 RepID=UPI0013E334CF|nr:alpha/beta hydrolase [Mesorhizobium sp. M7A.F.Ca.US.011.01.1.1]
MSAARCSRRRSSIRKLGSGIDVNTGRTKSDDWLSALRDLSVAGTNRNALEAYMASWTGTDLSARVSGTETHAHAILGELDLGASKTKIEETVGSWFKNLTVNEMLETGHYPMYERPAEFVGTVPQLLMRP